MKTRNGFTSLEGIPLLKYFERSFFFAEKFQHNSGDFEVGIQLAIVVGIKKAFKPIKN